MEERKDNHNPLTHLLQFNKVVELLQGTEMELSAYDYAMYMYLCMVWIKKFMPKNINASACREQLMGIVHHDKTVGKIYRKLIAAKLVSYKKAAGLHVHATVSFTPMYEDGFSAEDFVRQLLGYDAQAEKAKQEVAAVLGEEEPAPPTERSDDDLLLVAALIGFLRSKAKELGVEVGQKNDYEIFTKGENYDACFSLLHKLRTGLIGEEATPDYMKEQVDKWAGIAQKKELTKYFNPKGIDLKSNVFGITKPKNKQIPSKPKAKQIPNSK